jgi:hypothetical protein
MFACKTCAAHQEHIADLKAQVKNLMELAYPRRVAPSSKEDIEMDRILSGSDEYVSYTDEDAREADRILDGSDPLMVEVS